MEDINQQLHEAVLKGKIKIVKELLKQGFSINQPDQDGNTPLHKAVWYNQETVTEYLINNGADVKKATPDGQTPLHLAASLGRLKASKHSLSHGANMDMEDKDGFFPLLSAVMNGHLNVVRYFISQGEKVNQGNTEGWTPLLIAAAIGKLDVVKYLISQEAEVNKGDNESVTALRAAAQEGHLDVTKYLISRGAEVNKGDSEGATALHFAAQNCHIALTKYLIGHGAEVNKGDSEGATALHSAALSGHLNVTKYLIGQEAEVNEGNNDGSTALHGAAQEGHLHVTKYLISQGAEVNRGDNGGWTALHDAAQEGHLDVSKYLISQGAEVNRGDNDGWTSLHGAAQGGHLDVTEYLISRGAEAKKGDNDGKTALQLAARDGHIDVAKYLISQEAEVNKGDKDGKTALHFAASKGHIDLIKSLISQGAEVNRGDNEGRTSLHSAAQNGHLDVTDYLVSQEADVNDGENDGWTASHRAALSGHIDVTKFLTNQGAEVNKGDNDGKTALHLAAQEGHLDVIKYLISHGAEVNMCDRNGFTPMHIAALKDDLDSVKVLLEEGALVDVRDANGQNPLHLSSKKGTANSCDFLAEHAKINGTLDHRDDDGLTAIHIATQNGHTPVVESLVSHGSSLNIQSHDGKTCLHEAVILSDHMSRTEQTRTEQISEDFNWQELFRKKAALVLYILEHGGQMDIRDVEGKLPIHYATNEFIRQKIFSRLPSIEMITRYRAEDAKPLVTATAHVGNGGKQIELADLGISMIIPPGAVQGSGSCEITLTSIQDPQDLPGIDSQGGESLACLGIRCEPLNMTFNQPVTIKIPHSAVIVNPDQVKPDIVCRSWDSVKDLPRTSRNTTSSSPDEPPYCKVYKRHFELFIGHSAEWLVLIPLERQVIRHQLMCTPYIPETVERGKDIEVHLHVHADVPGMDSEVLHEEKHQSYRKAHRSVPFSVISDSGEVTVERDCEGKMPETKLLSVKEIHSRMRHNVVLQVPPGEDESPFGVITITITQSGKQGMSRSMAFVITYEEEIKSPEFTPAIRVIEGTSQNDLTDKDVQKIAEKLSIDDFYDLGIALGFTTQQLDAIEYKWLNDRQAAMCEMLITWTQLPHQNKKEELYSLLKSAETEAEKTTMTDITPTGDISDQDLLNLARRIKWMDFMEIGTKLGFSTNKLENIKHKTLQNRKDANIQMLCMWKASQRPGPEATKTLKCIWQSVSLASTAQDTDESLPMTSPVTSPPPSPVTSSAIRSKPSEPLEPEDMDIIRTSDTERYGISDDPDQCGGTPSTEELCSVALQVRSLPLACSLGKALRLNDDLIIGMIDLPSSSVLHKIARQLVDIWWNGLKEGEKEDGLVEILSELNIPDVKTGREEISKAIGSKTDLMDLCHRLDVKPSVVLKIMSTLMTFPPHIIGRIALKMLKEWVHQGGARERLLEVAQAFRFNDAAVKIAEAMKCQPSYMPFISHGIIDHRGGELTFDELGIAVSIPEGAIPKGIRSVVTLRIPTHDTPTIPAREGEVVITPVVEGSLTQELLKPATVVLPHCTNHRELTEDSSVILYTRTGPGTFGRRNLTPRTSEILKDKIKFRTRHLQVWALSSTDLQGLQLRCVVFQPLCITPAEKPTLRVYIIHPYRNYIEDITRKEKSSSVPYCQVMKEFRFSIQSTSVDLKILYHDGAKRNKRMMPIKSILKGKCSPLNFELQFSPEEKGKKNVYIDILQGSATLAEREDTLSIEDEPDYAFDPTDSHGRLQYVSNNLLEILMDVIPSLKDLKSLGYQLGISYSAVDKYLNRPDSSFDCVSRSGCNEMLRDWRRTVRPSEQVYELHLALQNAGLGHTAKVILPELRSSSRGHFERVRQGFESALVGATARVQLHEEQTDTQNTKEEEDHIAIESLPYETDEVNVKPIKMECCKRVGVEGGKLQLDSFGIELDIPPGAIDSEAPEEISLSVLTDTPNLGNSKEEMSVCFGVQCLAPDDLIIKLPVTYTMPHCAVITRTSSVEAVLYTGEGEYSPDAEVKEQIPLTPSGIPNCNIERDTLRLQMNHFSWAFIRFKLKNFFFRGKRMCCLPFAEKPLPEERIPVVLRAHLYDDIKGSKEMVSQEEDIVGFARVHPEAEVLINVAEVDVMMTCFIKRDPIGGDTVKYDELCRGHHRTRSFNLDLRSQPDEKIVVTLQVGQTGQSVEELLCIFKFTTPSRSASLPTRGQEQLQGASSSQTLQASHQRKGGILENISGRQKDFDQKLTTVARKVGKHDEVDNLGKALGLDPEDIQRYVDTNVKTACVSYMGTLSMLRDWRKKQTEATECEALKGVLRKAGQIHLADELFGT